MIKSGKVSSWLVIAGIYSTIACCFFISLSTTGMGLFGALVLLFWLISGKVALLPRLLRQSPVVVFATLLIALFIVGMFYSPEEWGEVLDVLKKYRELFFIPAIMGLLLNEDKRFADRAVNAYFAGCVVAMGISYGMAANLIDSRHYGHSLTYHITHSFLMASLAFWAAHRTLDAKRHRWLWSLLLLAVIGNIVYIAPGRTGMITFFLLCVLFLWQRLSWQKFAIGLAGFALALGLVTYSSNNIKIRLHEAYVDIQTYEPGISRSSLGMRFDWWSNCLRLIREKPLFGHGTGAFTLLHDRLIEGTDTKKTDNPHNEYLFISVQLGMVGLAAFLGLFVSGWLASRKQPPQNRWLAQGVIVSMAAGCLMNSFLFDSHQGHYFAFLLALLLIPSGPAGASAEGSDGNLTA